jgi:hypothetical protein
MANKKWSYNPLHAFMAWTRTTLHIGNRMLLVMVLYYVANY